MRKFFVIAAAATAFIFAAGFAVGQIAGIAGSSAATHHSQTQHHSGSAWFHHSDFGRGAGPVRGRLMGLMHKLSGPYATGLVTAVNGDEVTISQTARTPLPLSGESASVRLIVVTSKTNVHAGMAMGTIADVKVGDRVVGLGKLSDDGSRLTASALIVLPRMASHMLQTAMKPHVFGKVTAVHGDTLTIAPVGSRLMRPASAVTSVVVTAHTQVHGIPGVLGKASQPASFRVGETITATGTLNSAGKTLTASSLVVLPSSPARAIRSFFGTTAAGTVTAVSDGVVTIRARQTSRFDQPTRNGAVTSIHISKSTDIYNGFGKGSSKDIKIGDMVIGFGKSASNGKTLDASRVVVLGNASTMPWKGLVPGFGHRSGGMSPFEHGPVPWLR